MEIVSNRDETIFRRDFDGKALYSIGISKKNQDGSYDNGYIPVRFKKDVELDNKTKIRINTAWLDFYLTKDNKTSPYIFICDFDKVEEKKDVFAEYEKLTAKTKIEEQLQITDEDLPF